MALFVAINTQGHKCSLLDDGPSLMDLKARRSKEKFYCEMCGGEVVLKLGTQVAWHFAHKQAADCPLNHEPESIHHQLGKMQLYYWLKDNQTIVHCEHYISKIQQRADLFLQLKDAPLAIEYQCSTIPIELLASRTRGYQSLNIDVIWLLGGERLKAAEKNVYKLSTMDAMVCRYDQQLPTLLYYNTRTDCFVFLYPLATLTTSRILGVTKTLPRNLVSPQLFSYKPKVSMALKDWIQPWLKQKERWRTKPLAIFTHEERYLYTMCRHKRKLFSCFPAFVGIPMMASFILSTPTYVWQMWLVLTFIDRPSGTILHLKTITQAFSKMIQKSIFHLRPSLYTKPSIKHVVTGYFNFLIRANILAPLAENKYQVIQPMEWKNEDLDTLLKWDNDVLRKYY
ncbi:competence protein CoiA [Pullulanibacillus pueri]|uniref:Competence protein n=1 Tax=Pullulanibacillus pueri TaxID=1437324 RepID=A0A8J2ZXK5_9BACL|nr:competence protein CoiA family protein [Pullulanibacillus pueri]GGH83995.1 competence protein [Pullulanibacillus pueri]